MSFFQLFVFALVLNSLTAWLLCYVLGRQSFWLYMLLAVPLTLCSMFWWWTVPLVPDAPGLLPTDTALQWIAMMSAPLWALLAYLFFKRWRSMIAAAGGGFLAVLFTALIVPMLSAQLLQLWYPSVGRFVNAVQGATPPQQLWLHQFVQACPGVEQYAADVEWGKVRDSFDDGSFRVEFKIADQPSVLPAPLNKRSAGHHCHINMAVNRLEADMGKRACHSICVGQWRDNQPNSFGWRFLLAAP